MKSHQEEDKVADDVTRLAKRMLASMLEVPSLQGHPEIRASLAQGCLTSATEIVMADMYLDKPADK